MQDTPETPLTPADAGSADMKTPVKTPAELDTSRLTGHPMAPSRDGEDINTGINSSFCTQYRTACCHSQIVMKMHFHINLRFFCNCKNSIIGCLRVIKT